MKAPDGPTEAELPTGAPSEDRPLASAPSEDDPPEAELPTNAPSEDRPLAESPSEVGEDLLEQATEWQLLHDLFRPPDPAQWDWLVLPEVGAALACLAGRQGDAGAPFPLPETYDAFSAEFLAAFDVGLPEPPCPLLESHWNRAEPPGQVRLRNLRFFEQFGLRLRSADGSPPDHLRHQLELLRYLCLLERERRSSGQPGEAAQIALGRADFLRLHLRSWVPAAAASLAAALPGAWPSRWMALLAAAIGEESDPLGQGGASTL